MYNLFFGFQKLGEFESILEAKQCARKSGLCGVFNIVNQGKSDGWYADYSQVK